MSKLLCSFIYSRKKTKVSLKYDVIESKSASIFLCSFSSNDYNIYLDRGFTYVEPKFILKFWIWPNDVLMSSLFAIAITILAEELERDVKLVYYLVFIIWDKFTLISLEPSKINT